MSGSVQSAPAAGGRKGRNIALWILQAVLAVVFVMAGASKIAGAKDMVDLFQDVGAGQWLRYVTGSLELVGAVLLLVPRLSALGGLVLTGVMTGAVVTCLSVVDRSPAPPAVLLVLAAVVTWTRRERVLGAVGKGVTAL
ncbi:DoxX family protein [Streptomyces sp. NPDC002574]|uniref:DoxX family protein n=1 Tax=Streptomyces sp. NPDC002574 TaxID=3364652 RepID=UPI0036B5695F